MRVSVLDASFQNDVDVEGKLVVKDASVNAHLSVLDASSRTTLRWRQFIWMDRLILMKLQNITTINNEVLISTQLDISNREQVPL